MVNYWWFWPDFCSCVRLLWTLFKGLRSKIFVRFVFFWISTISLFGAIINAFEHLLELPQREQSASQWIRKAIKWKRKKRKMKRMKIKGTWNNITSIQVWKKRTSILVHKKNAPMHRLTLKSIHTHTGTQPTTRKQLQSYFERSWDPNAPTISISIVNIAHYYSVQCTQNQKVETIVDRMETTVKRVYKLWPTYT